MCASHSADTFTENCCLRIWVTDYNWLNLQEASQSILLTWFSAQRSSRVMLLTWSAKENLVSVLWNGRRRNALIATDTLLDNNCPLESSKREWVGEGMVQPFRAFRCCVSKALKYYPGGASFQSNGKVTELAMNQWATQSLNLWLDLDNVTSLLAQFLYQPVRHSKDSFNSSNSSHYFQFHKQYMFLKENVKHE